MDLGVCILGAGYRTEYVNGHLAQMLGGAREAIEGALFLSLVPEDARAEAAAYLDACRDGAGGQQDLPLRSGDGRAIWVLVCTQRLPETAEVPGLACFMVEITERRLAEGRLRKSEAHYRVLAETAEDHIFIIDRDDCVEYVNQAAARQMRTVPERLLGRRRTDIFPPDVAKRQGRSLRHVFSTGAPLYVEGRTLYLDREVWLGTWLAPVPDEHGGVRAVLGLSRDMTERKRLETELSNAQKLEAIGRLAGGIAHDFNNNLTAILGYVEMMLADLGPDTPTGRDLREVQLAAERAAGLVQRLLAFGRRQVLQPRAIGLNTVVENLKPMLDRLIGEQVQIALALAADLRLVTGDAGELEQVIMNLALNARDAMPGGGTLTIETSTVRVGGPDQPTMPPGTYVLMTIRDTGHGMDSLVKQHVFEPFFTTKPVGQGTGLGLSTVYGIVKQLDGFIWVDSAVGQGTAFHVYLPAAGVEGVAEPAPDEAARLAAGGRRGTILLVEDEGTVRRFARLALERHGFLVVEAATPEDALALAEGGAQGFSLLLTDVVMPRTSGPELAERLRRTWPDLPVLYMSGYPSTLVRDGGILDPSMRLLPKPFTPTELLAHVDEVLEGPAR
jgi:PAS domain S-box-containing protein